MISATIIIMMIMILMVIIIISLYKVTEIEGLPLLVRFLRF